ncbi:MAG TPA: FCD domain-containing protein, partial [Arthrobacter sp.]
MDLLDSWTARQDRVVRVGAAEAVFASLRGAIEGGKIPVGTRLDSETSLAKQYGVSRTMVREALRSCTALGLTATHTGKGTFVIADRVASDLKLGKYSARALVEARPHIEVPAAGLAAERRSNEDVEALREILQEMSGADDLQQWVLLNTEFHATIARCSGNGVFPPGTMVLKAHSTPCRCWVIASRAPSTEPLSMASKMRACSSPDS